MLEKKTQFNIYLPPSLIKAVKHRAIDDQLSLSDWVERAIKESVWISRQSESLLENEPMTSNQPLKFMPIIHVKNMPDSVRFYEALGAKVVVGSRDGDWVQIRLGESEIGLLAHPPSPGEGEIEIAFAYTNALAELQTTLESNGVAILRGAGDEAFGEQLQILDPDGRKVKINVIETELIS